eukprot:CAMPEP_0197018966 /NCGR_PEP_ID=MMETSP1380-20130617/80415_1 /TAXON_ID=5936 /ORGANISM="Euplotes crassus, Strain CT5" /LENGTH=199 /DNA_ID=CAMNT_0042446287 /DNA_START=2015 /DNA_END=2611 /DNA_ORIENTATION=-
MLNGLIIAFILLVTSIKDGIIYLKNCRKKKKVNDESISKGSKIEVSQFDNQKSEKDNEGLSNLEVYSNATAKKDFLSSNGMEEKKKSPKKRKLSAETNSSEGGLNRRHSNASVEDEKERDKKSLGKSGFMPHRSSKNAELKIFDSENPIELERNIKETDLQTPKPVGDTLSVKISQNEPSISVSSLSRESYGNSNSDSS